MPALFFLWYIQVHQRHSDRLVLLFSYDENAGSMGVSMSWLIGLHFPGIHDTLRLHERGGNKRERREKEIP